MKAKTLTAALLSCSLLLTGATVFAADAMAKKTHSTKHAKKAGTKTPATKTAPAPKDDAAK